MRQRKAKDLEKRLQACSTYMVYPGSDGNKEYFRNGNPVFVEIGCGKGQFIINKAISEPECNFIAVEGQETVILRALEKARLRDEQERKNGGRGLSNLKFMLTFVDDMDEIFCPGQLSGIYLNFSDPWPKARHAKRRLTYRERLVNYGRSLKKGGFIEIKTDNDDLFMFTLDEIEAVGFNIVRQTRDLHASIYAAANITTEYEDRFDAEGKNINYVKVTV